jgi:hypothetical protein
MIFLHFKYLFVLSIKKKIYKVPQFSFSRLAGADVILGVEMLSTGEVACFGRTRWEAYLKGLLATGFTLPERRIFISIGGVYAKEEMLESVKTLDTLGFELFGSKGTADFYSQNGISVSDFLFFIINFIVTKDNNKIFF